MRSRDVVSIQREAAGIAERTGRDTYVLDVGQDGLLCPIFVSRLESSEVPIYMAKAPAGCGKRRLARNSVPGRIATFLKECGTSSPKQIRLALGLTEKQVSGGLGRNLETFESVGYGLWRIRTPGVRDLPFGGRKALHEAVRPIDSLGEAA
jgi:hypothetical protein